MDHDEETDAKGMDAPKPEGVYNYTTLVATGPDASRDIALDQAVKLALHNSISADSVLDFAGQFRAFLDPPTPPTA